MAYNSQGFGVRVMPQTNFIDPRLLAPDARFGEAMQQGIGTARQLGDLTDSIIKRRRDAATEAYGIAADNARNQLLEKGSLAGLANVDLRAAAEASRFRVNEGQDKGTLANLPTLIKLNEVNSVNDLTNAELAKRVADNTFDYRVNSGINNAISDGYKSEAGILNADTSRRTAEQTRDWSKTNPDATGLQLTSGLNEAMARNSASLNQIASGGVTQATKIAMAKSDAISKQKQEDNDFRNKTFNLSVAKFDNEIKEQDENAKRKNFILLRDAKLSSGEVLGDAYRDSGPRWWTWQKYNDEDRAAIAKFTALTSSLADSSNTTATNSAAKGVAIPNADTKVSGGLKPNSIYSKNGVYYLTDEYGNIKK